MTPAQIEAATMLTEVSGPIGLSEWRLTDGQVYAKGANAIDAQCALNARAAAKAAAKAVVPGKLPRIDESRGWRQPKGLRDRVGIYWNHATISERDWRQLANYETSVPSGVYPGKAWRRGHLLCWFGPDIGGRCKIGHLRALVQ